MNISDDDDDDKETQDDTQSKGKSSTATQAPPEPIDTDAIAEAVLARMTQRSGQRATAAQKSDVEELVESLAKQGYHKDYIEGQFQTVQSIDKMIEKKLGEAQAQLTIQNRDKTAATTINTILRQAYKDTPALKEFDASIRKELVDKFNANARWVKEWNQLQVNEAGIEECADAAIEKFAKFIPADEGRPAKAKGTLSVDAGKTSGKGKQEKVDKEAEGEEEGGIWNRDYGLNIDSLDEHQRAAYNTAWSNNVRRFKMSEKDAKKDAFKYAKQLDATSVPKS